MKTVLQIKGTHCHSCKMLIEDACSEIPGITHAALDFKTGKLVVEHEKSLDLKRVKKEIEELGDYKVSL